MIANNLKNINDMTNKFFSSVDGNHSRVASDLPSRCSRLASLSIVSRQSLFSILLFVLLLGVGQMWGAETLKTTCVGTGSGYGTRRTETYNNIGWVLSSGQLSQGTTYLGTNSATNHGKVKPTADDLPVVKAQNAGATTTTTGYYFYYTSTAISNVTKIEFSYTAKSGSTTVNAYIVSSSTAASSGSATWSKPTLASGTGLSAQGTNIASATGTYTFKLNAKETSSKYYGIILQTSSTSRLTSGSIKIYVDDTPATTPTLNLTGSGAFGSVETSSNKDLNFTLTGSNLTANATVTVSGTGFSRVAPANGTLTQTSGSITGSNNITVRFAPTTTGSHNGTLTVTSTGATQQTINLTGTGTAPTPSLSRNPASLNWSTVNKGAELSTKTFTISGSNLTGNLSVSATGGYTVSCGSSITVTNGAPSVTSITVTPPSTSTAGTKNGTITISGGGASSISVSCSLTVNEIDQFIDDVQNTSGYSSANPHIAAGSYGTTPSLSDKAVATSGTCEQQHYHFVGWITAAKYEAGTAIDAGDLQTPTSATGATYYAAWAKQGAGGASSPTEYIMNSSGSLNTNWQDDQDRNNGIQSYAGKSSFQMYGETKTMNPCELTSQIRFTNITGISINVAANNANTVSLYYSADGSSWETWGNTVSVAKNTSSYTDYDFNLTNFPSGSYYICISNSTSSMYMYSVTITSGSAPTYTDYIAKCCTPLVSINGSINLSHF